MLTRPALALALRRSCPCPILFLPVWSWGACARPRLTQLDLPCSSAQGSSCSYPAGSALFPLFPKHLLKPCTHAFPPASSASPSIHPHPSTSISIHPPARPHPLRCTLYRPNIILSTLILVCLGTIPAMQYSTLFVAAAAVFSGLVSAQNTSMPLPAGVQPCCTVPANNIPSSLRSEWCRASQNTCPEICGGQGQIASGGNNCDSQTLEHTCQCRNNTRPNLAEYEQTIEGQMCRFWHAQCINATNQDAALQFNCNSVRDAQCGNKTSKAATSSSSGGPTASRSPTSGGSGGNGGNGGSQTSSGSSGAQSSPAAAAALDAARLFGTPVLAGGIAAIFGLVL